MDDECNLIGTQKQRTSSLPFSLLKSMIKKNKIKCDDVDTSCMFFFSVRMLKIEF